MPKRIFINGRFLLRPTTGVERVAYELIKRLKDQPGLDLVLVTPKTDAYQQAAATLGIEHYACGHIDGHRWEQTQLGPAMRKLPLLNLCNTAPIFNRRQLVYIHDAATFTIPWAYTFGFRWWYRLSHFSLAQRAKIICTNSHFSASELKRYLHLDERKLHIISPGVEHISSLTSTPIAALADKTSPFVFILGSHNKNKNHQLVFDALNLLHDMPLLCASSGNINPKVFQNFNKVHDKVLPLGYLSDAEIKWAFEHAQCFIFPSLYEGFGIPPVEAMACGCPVIAARSASLPEVCGPFAHYCSPHDAQELAASLRQVINAHKEDAAAGAEAKQARIKHAQQYSWDVSAKQLGELCYEL